MSDLDSENSKQFLANLLKQENPQQILLITAKDNIRRRRSLDNLKTKFFKDSSVSVYKINAQDWTKNTKSEIINNLNSLGLFAPVSLVEIDNVDFLAKAEQLDELLECLNYATERNSLWLSSAPLAKTNKLRKKCSSLNSVLEFPDLKGSTLKAWIKKEAELNGLINLSDQILTALVELTDESPDEIVRIIEQLGLYSNDGNISYAEFSRLYPDLPEESEFALLDLIHFSKVGLVEAKLTKFFQEGKNAFMFLGLLMRTYSKYVALRSLLDAGVTGLKARESLALKEWTFKKYMEVVSKKNLRRLHSDLESLLRADSKLKNKSLGETEIFCELAGNLTVGGR